MYNLLIVLRMFCMLNGLRINCTFLLCNELLYLHRKSFFIQLNFEFYNYSIVQILKYLFPEEKIIFCKT